MTIRIPGACLGLALAALARELEIDGLIDDRIREQHPGEADELSLACAQVRTCPAQGGVQYDARGVDDRL